MAVTGFDADTPILVGHFDSAEAARAVASELRAAGYAPQDVDQSEVEGPAAIDRAGSDASGATSTQASERPAGVRVAVREPLAQRNGRVLGVFARHKARAIEEARGVWRDGRWQDFDPVSIPRWLMPPQRQPKLADR